MTYFDKECNIIKYLQDTGIRDVHIATESKEIMKFFLSIYDEKLYKKWVDNSGNTSNPPDLYSDEYKYMLEVMRVDDYELNNSPAQLESKWFKRIEKERRENNLPTLEELNVKAILLPDLSKAGRNDYGLYISNMKRIVGKHIGKIEKYRENHPGYKLGFLILDESPGYAIHHKKLKKIRFGQVVKVEPHWHFLDRSLLHIFLNSEVDYVIWMTPYKNLPQNPPIYPRICLFDIEALKKREGMLIDYDPKSLICLEV